MKKFVLMVAVLVFALVSVVCCAETAKVAPEMWYELTDGSVLTIRLPDAADDGLDWEFEISSPEHMELLTFEVVEGDKCNEYVASFAGFAGEAADVTVIYKYVAEGEELPVSTRVVEMKVNENNEITVLAVIERDQTAEWLEYDAEQFIMTVRLPDDDDAWTVTQVEEGTLELITCETVDGVHIASYFATLEKAGDTEISFASGEDEMYTVALFVNEAGEMFFDYAETFTVCE